MPAAARRPSGSARAPCGRACPGGRCGSHPPRQGLQVEGRVGQRPSGPSFTAGGGYRASRSTCETLRVDSATATQRSPRRARSTHTLVRGRLDAHGAPSASVARCISAGGARSRLPRRSGHVDVRDGPGSCRARCAAGRASPRRASCSSEGGKCSPRSPSPAAPSRASITACVTRRRRSAPRGPVVLDLDPAEHQRRPSRTGGCRIRCRPSSPSCLRCVRRHGRSKAADLAIPQPRIVSTAAAYSPADVLGDVRVRGERERGAGLHEHPARRGGRIELAPPACAGRRWRPRRRRRFRPPPPPRLVVEARVARPAAAGRPPHLHEVGVGQDVEEAGRAPSATVSK